jgi:M6 family metalloprotease-like protein
MKRYLIFMLCILPLIGYAAYLENIVSEVTQPNGTVLQLFASGDEYANRLHDAQGYTIIQSPIDGYYYYATIEANEPAPSQWRVGTVNPANMGLTPNINISPAARDQKVQFMKSHELRNERGPNMGTVNNLNVFIRFSDQTEFTLPREVYDARFNDEGENAISLKNYYEKVSYNQLHYVTHHYPECLPQESLSYQDNHPRSYFLPYNAVTNPGGYNNSDERAMREQTLLADAIAAIAPQIPPSLNIDADNDGHVDNVCFIIRGPHAAWADLLWAHRWVLYVADAFINGKQVWDFTFQPEDQNNVRTLCHEMFHSVGAPDLYHYTFNGVTPAGCWDIMESGNGHMGMYMKYKYGGWIGSIPAATIGQTYTLNPVTSPTNNVLKLAVPGSNSQYLVMEYRKRGSDVFEAELPGSGLIIYRINQNYEGNSNGPPDEVYVFRPNGTTTINGQIADAAFSADAWRTDFNAYTCPNAFLTNGNPMQVNINNISAIGETISFQVSQPTADLAPVISAISPVSGSILANNDFTVTADISAPNSDVAWAEFLVDGTLVSSDDMSPYTALINGGALSLGLHDIEVKAYSANGMLTNRTSLVNIIDPSQQNWFSWLSDNSLLEEYGRGAVPIKVAVDFDLGDQQYLVKALKFSMVADAWGQPAIPGFINAKINRFANGAISEQTLIPLGDIINNTYEQNYTFTVTDTTRVSGQIAVILDLFEYQNILFDINAPCGHSWLTEPNRQWTDALGRGMLGAAAIELLLQAPTVASQDNYLPPAALSLSNYPNPFTGSTTMNYNIKEATPIKLEIYNLKGQLVKTLVNGISPKGNQTITWDGKDNNGRACTSGIYFSTLHSGNAKVSRKLLLYK